MRETTQQFISPFHVSLLCKSFTPRITQSITKFLMQRFLCKRKKNESFHLKNLQWQSCDWQEPQVTSLMGVPRFFFLLLSSIGVNLCLLPVKCTYFQPINYVNNFSLFPDGFYIFVFARLSQLVHSKKATNIYVLSFIKLVTDSININTECYFRQQR